VLSVMKVALRYVCNISFYNDVLRGKVVQNLSTFINYSWKGFVGTEQG
jgi:hypothetical protein